MTINLNLEMSVPLFSVKSSLGWVWIVYNPENHRNHHASKHSSVFYKTLLKIVYIY